MASTSESEKAKPTARADVDSAAMLPAHRSRSASEIAEYVEGLCAAFDRYARVPESTIRALAAQRTANQLAGLSVTFPTPSL